MKEGREAAKGGKSLTHANLAALSLPESTRGKVNRTATRFGIED